MTENANDKLVQLQALLKEFSAAELKAALKAAEASKPTMLSVTMDCICAAQLAGNVTTENVAKAVTAKARECELLKADEDATHSSVAQLIRHVQAHDAAMVRAGYEWSKKAIAPAEDTPTGEPASASGSGEPSMPANAAPPAAETPKQAPAANGTGERRKAA